MNEPSTEIMLSHYGWMLHDTEQPTSNVEKMVTLSVPNCWQLRNQMSDSYLGKLLRQGRREQGTKTPR